MTLFDTYIFVDWSAVNSVQPAHPIANAVWVGELDTHSKNQCETYFRTRNAAFKHVLNALLSQVKDGKRVLAGFDFPYGYPTGFSKALALPSGLQSWWAVWAELAFMIHDNAKNENNRFEVASELNAIVGKLKSGPLWGCPVGTVIQDLQPRSPGYPFFTNDGGALERLRIVEGRLSGVQETWKLYGAGSVGSQALVGIPYVYKLRRNPDLAHDSRVWPFETGFTSTPSPNHGPFILHAEIWPGVVKDRVTSLKSNEPELINDCAQVRAMCEWASECDQNGMLGKLFDSPKGLTPNKKRICVQEEGWILGTP